MSSNLSVFQQQLPAELREQFANLAAVDLDRLGSTGGGDFIRLSNDKKFILADGTEIQQTMSGVIVDFVYSNNYYLGAYNPKNLQPAACFALHSAASGMVPSPNSPMKQSESCDVCQHNEWGSSPTGEGKACKNNVLIALLPPDADEDTEISVIRLSPTSIKPFNKHVANVAKYGAPIYGVVTTLSFAEDTTYASLRFDIEKVNDKFAIANAARESARRRLMTEPDVSGFEPPKGKK